jgi:hypothetical protein
VDAWRRVTNRDNTLERWAEALQNDFRARLDWCVSEPDKANHPPVVRLTGDRERRVTPGEKVQLDASPSSDPDGHPLRFEWFFYPEAGVWIERVPTLAGADSARAAFVVPETLSDRPLHLVVAVTDSGAPPLTRYGRTVFRIGRAAESAAGRAE